MPARPQDAAPFHALHRDFLILPNAWDAVSALLIAREGAKAIATSSAALAWARGYPDGHGLPIEKLIECVEEIARVIDVPISVDSEAGYADTPEGTAENIARLIGVGAVGINLEDGKWPHELHLKKIEAIRAVAERAGVNLYINARTDVYLKQLVPEGERPKETLRRARAIREAGASGLFVPGVLTDEEISTFASGVDLPLNIISLKGVQDAARLKALGAKRLSGAAGIFHAASATIRAAARAFLEGGDSNALAALAGEKPDYNGLLKR
jgi:2-methylisocitrate lyase-like PEP mutase family enzyme